MPELHFDGDSWRAWLAVQQPVSRRGKSGDQKKLFSRFAVLSQTLERQDYWMAGGFGIAGAYLFTVLRWARLFEIDLEEWPAVQAALAAELA